MLYIMFDRKNSFRDIHSEIFISVRFANTLVAQMAYAFRHMQKNV